MECISEEDEKQVGPIMYLLEARFAKEEKRQREILQSVLVWTEQSHEAQQQASQMGVSV